MKLNFIFKVAFRYLFSYKEERIISVTSLFAIISMKVGVFALIVVTSFMECIHKDLINTVIDLTGEIKIQHNFYNQFTLNNKLKKTIDEIKKIHTVKTVHPQIITTTFCQIQENIYPIILLGVEPELAKERVKNQDNLQDILSKTQSKKHFPAIISSHLAKKFNLKKNDLLKTLPLNFLHNSSFSTNQIHDKFYVAKIVKKISGFGQENCIVSSNYHVQKLLKKPNVLSEIFITTNAPNETKNNISLIKNTLNEKKYFITSWKDHNKSFLQSIIVEKNAMIIILSLILFIANFNIISNVFMIVKNKFAEISILRSIGASKTNILFIFGLVGIFISSIGIILGAGLALLVIIFFEKIKLFLYSNNHLAFFDLCFNFIKDLKIELDIYKFSLIILMSLILAMFASLYPALIAANASPRQGIK